MCEIPRKVQRCSLLSSKFLLERERERASEREREMDRERMDRESSRWLAHSSTAHNGRGWAEALP